MHSLAQVTFIVTSSLNSVKEEVVDKFKPGT